MLPRTVYALALTVLVLALLVTMVTLVFGRPGPCEGCWKALERDANGHSDLPDPAMRPSSSEMS